MSAPVANNTRSQCKECKKCDFCLIKKELSRLNQMIICPIKAEGKKLMDESQPITKKKRKMNIQDEKPVEEVENTEPDKQTVINGLC